MPRNAANAVTASPAAIVDESISAHAPTVADPPPSTVETLAATIGHSTKTVQRMIARGEIPATRRPGFRGAVIDHKVVESLRLRVVNGQPIAKPSPGHELHRARVTTALAAVAAIESKGEVPDPFRVAVDNGLTCREVEEALRQRSALEEFWSGYQRDRFRRREAEAVAEQRALRAERAAQATYEAVVRPPAPALDPVDVIGSDAWLHESVMLECRAMLFPGDTIASLARHLGNDAAAWVRVEAWCAAHRDEIHAWQAGTQ
jgi:hypothetical protein